MMGSASATKTGKRPLRSLSAIEKLEAIRRVHDGESKASVARDIGVPESTLRGWCKNEGKITYLSRQSSSPETDESAIEPKEKRAKHPEDANNLNISIQPFNLSLKASTSYTPIDYSKSDILDATAKTPQNLSIKTETPKSTASQISEREKNRAELARLSVELGLNRPEMFNLANLQSVASGSATSSSSATLADLATNINILSQWNNIMMHQQMMGTKTKNPAETSSGGKSASSCSQSSAATNAKLDEYVKLWLRAQEMLMSQQGSSAQNSSRSSSATNNNNNNNGGYPSVSSTTASANSSNILGTNGLSNTYNNWLMNLSLQQSALSSCPASGNTAEKPILYQQLTKEPVSADSNSHQLQQRLSPPISFATSTTGDHKVNNNNNHSAINNNNNLRKKSVLDNLLNSSVSNSWGGEESLEENLSQTEALIHGEKFMKWLESCGDPSVTAVHVLQLKTLLNNLRNSIERRNGGEVPLKTKVKRK